MEKDTKFEHLEGLIAATFTPFHEDGQINLEPIPAMVEHLAKCSIRAIFINGTTGEGPSLTEEERITLAENFVTEAKKIISKVLFMSDMKACKALDPSQPMLIRLEQTASLQFLLPTLNHRA